MMTSRERVQEALEHREADRVPLDLGASDVTGMHVDSVYKLRQALQLDASRHSRQSSRADAATGRGRAGPG